MDPRPIRIGFDARLAGSRHAGIGRYAEKLLHELLKHKTTKSGRKILWVVLISTHHDLDWLEKKDKLLAHVEVHQVSVRHYSIAEQLWWPWYLWKLKLDLIHVPHFNVPLLYPRKFTITIHDLLWHQQRDPRATTLRPNMHRLKYWLYRVVSTIAIWRASLIFVPSKYVQKEVLTWTKRWKGVFVTYEGVSEPYRSVVLSSRKRSKNPYIVYTGSLYPHKNVQVLLRALRLLPGWKLKIISARSVFTDRIVARAKRMNVSHQLELLGFVPDSFVIKEYQESVAVLQPSLSEGFGLTGLEALASGAHLVAADTEVFHEIYDEHASYFPPHDAYILSQVLGALYREKRSEKQRIAAQRYARGFDWGKMATETWLKMNSLIDVLE